MADEDFEPNHKGKSSRRRKVGVSMRVPGVAVHLEQETVGELSERYIDDEQQSEKRSDFLRLLTSLVGVVFGIVAALTEKLPLGGNAISILAAVTAIAVLSVALLVADSIHERSLPTEPRPLTPNLRTLRGDLATMRRPLLERSRVDKAPDAGEADVGG